MFQMQPGKHATKILGDDDDAVDHDICEVFVQGTAIVITCIIY
jgi:hypothetical protein